MRENLLQCGYMPGQGGGVFVVFFFPQEGGFKSTQTKTLITQWDPGLELPPKTHTCGHTPGQKRLFCSIDFLIFNFIIHISLTGTASRTTSFSLARVWGSGFANIGISLG